MKNNRYHKGTKERKNINMQKLDITTLNLGDESYSLCYLQEIKPGKSVDGRNYFTMYFKDCKGNVVVGRFFNVNNENALLIVALKKKLVEIQYLVDEYNNSISLIIEQIRLHNDVTELTPFLGVVDNIDEKCALYKKVFKNDPPLEYYKASINRIYGGRVGGYIKLIEMVMYKIIPAIELTSSSLKKHLEIILRYYFRFLKETQDLEVIPNRIKFEIISKMELEDVDYVVKETVGALMGLNDTEMLMSHIIFSAIKESILLLDLVSEEATLLTGTTKVINGVRITKI